MCILVTLFSLMVLLTVITCSSSLLTGPMTGPLTGPGHLLGFTSNFGGSCYIWVHVVLTYSKSIGNRSLREGPQLCNTFIWNFSSGTVFRTVGIQHSRDGPPSPDFLFRDGTPLPYDTGVKISCGFLVILSIVRLWTLIITLGVSEILGDYSYDRSIEYGSSGLGYTGSDVSSDLPCMSSSLQGWIGDSRSRPLVLS